MLKILYFYIQELCVYSDKTEARSTLLNILFQIVPYF